MEEGKSIPASLEEYEAEAQGGFSTKAGGMRALAATLIGGGEG